MDGRLTFKKTDIDGELSLKGLVTEDKVSLSESVITDDVLLRSVCAGDEVFNREVGGRYVLQYAGHRVIDAIQSGVFHTTPTMSPTEAPGACPRCGTAPTFAYDDHLATVACPECERKLIEYPFDPGGFQGRSVTEAIEAFDRRTKFNWRLASDGVCFVCAGRVRVTYTETSAEIEHMDRYDEFFAADHPALFHLSCENCSFYSYVPVGIRLLDSASAVGQLVTRGVDVETDPLWELPFVTEADCVTVRGRDPWEVVVDAPTPTGTVAVTLDGDADVASITVER